VSAARACSRRARPKRPQSLPCGALSRAARPRPPAPRQGFDIAKKAALEFAAELKVPVKMTGGVPDRDIVVQVARTALRTKLHTQLADQARCTRRRNPSLRADASGACALCAVDGHSG